MGCEENCILVFPNAMVPCVDFVDAVSRCRDAVAPGAICNREREQAKSACKREQDLLAQCMEGPRAPRKPLYVGPAPPPIDRSNPNARFCTALPGADHDDVSTYQRRQANPAGWALDRIETRGGVTYYCFYVYPADAP